MPYVPSELLNNLLISASLLVEHVENTCDEIREITSSLDDLSSNISDVNTDIEAINPYLE